MAKWELNEAFGKVVITGTTNIYCDSNSSAEVAKMLHNADIDELEAQLRDEQAPTMFVRNELAAANATLDKLREVVPRHGYWPINDDTTDGITQAIDAILYPTTETTP